MPNNASVPVFFRHCFRQLELALIVGLSLGSSVALGEEPTDAPVSTEACLEAHEQSQLLRSTSGLLKAKETSLICARSECPALVRADCARWFADLQGEVPSVVLRARSEKGDEIDVDAYLDGKLITERLDGRSFDIDPGVHQFRMELAPWPPVSQEILITAGEQDRVLTFVFGDPDRQKREAEQRALERSKPAPELPRPVPVMTYVMGGVAVAGVGVFATMSYLGKKDFNTLKDSCAPFCEDEELASMRKKFLIGDISLAAGTAALLVGGIIYFTRPAVEPTAAATEAGPALTSIGLFPTLSGAAVGASGRF